VGKGNETNALFFFPIRERKGGEKGGKKKKRERGGEKKSRLLVLWQLTSWKPWQMRGKEEGKKKGGRKRVPLYLGSTEEEGKGKKKRGRGEGGGKRMRCTFSVHASVVEGIKMAGEEEEEMGRNYLSFFPQQQGKGEKKIRQQKEGRFS